MTCAFQVVATYPVMNPSIEFLKKCLLDTLGILHQTGFQVLITIAASNTSNRKVSKDCSMFANLLHGF